MKTINFNVAISRFDYPKVESESIDDVIYQIKLYSMYKIYVRYYFNHKHWKPHIYWTALHRCIQDICE